MSKNPRYQQPIQYRPNRKDIKPLMIMPNQQFYTIHDFVMYEAKLKNNKLVQK